MTYEELHAEYLSLQEDRDKWWKKAEAAEVRVKELDAALVAVNAIRNSIVGAQAFNWSKHAYPLVQILNDAGYAGQPYPEARAHVGSLIAQREAAEAKLAKAREVLFAVRDAMAATDQAPDATAKENWWDPRRPTATLVWQACAALAADEEGEG